MINRILMELYDEYKNDNIKAIEEFANKTFKDINVKNLFIGCILIMFNNANGYKSRYDCTRENLLDIVLSMKEKINNTNLLAIYVDKINTEKGISKYLNNTLLCENIDKYSDVLIDYLEQFKSKFIKILKSHKKNKINYK